MKSLTDRTQLIQAAFQHLKSSRIDATLSCEKVLDRAGRRIFEPCISLKRSDTINKISLNPLVGITYSGTESKLRFHFLVVCENRLPVEFMDGIRCTTGKKPEGIKWTGHELAEVLNRDENILQALYKCEKTALNLDFQIEAASSQEVYILGPKFTSPCELIPPFLAKYSDDIDLDCVFGLKTAEKIARHIRELSNPQ